MRRREVVLAVLATGVAPPHLGVAQDRAKLGRVGFLGPAPAENFAPRVDALRAGLRDLGHVEGKDLIFEFRWWERPDEMPELAAELVRAGLDVLVAPSSAETHAFLSATKTVPIVFSTHGDPVGLGHVASLARPGGNATGLTTLLTELVAKELEALKEALPQATRFGVLWSPTTPHTGPSCKPPRLQARNSACSL